jgi:hypothetical protein
LYVNLFYPALFDFSAIFFFWAPANLSFFCNDVTFHPCIYSFIHAADMLGLLLGVALVGWPCVMDGSKSFRVPAMGRVHSDHHSPRRRGCLCAAVAACQDPGDSSCQASAGPVRVYCGQPGLHTITVQTASRQLPSLHNRVYRFVVASSGRSRAVGRLRVHAQDPHQFQYDNGDWFLHVGEHGVQVSGAIRTGVEGVH